MVSRNLASLYNFFSQSYVAQTRALSLILVGSVTVFVVGKTFKTLKEKKDWTWLTLIILFGFGYLGLFIHGDPPAHYYMTLFPIPVLFLSILLNDLQKKSRLLVIIILLAISVVNLSYYFSKNWFFLPQEQVPKEGCVPYGLQLETARIISKTAKGKPFSLSRIGAFDQFEADYAQNYQYLLWRLGNEPVKEAKLHYTIYEDMTHLPQFYRGKLYRIGNLALLRTDKQESNPQEGN